MKKIKLAIVGGLLAGALTIPDIAAIADDHGTLRVPPGHLPPPGKCRIWYPGTPPGRQPPPGDCRILSRRLSSGAWLVSRDRVWRYNDRPYRYYSRPYASYQKPSWHNNDRHPRGRYDGGGYFDRREIKQRDARAARKNVQESRQQLQKDVAELKKDRAELHSDIRNRASRKEIRDDARNVAASKKTVRQSENRLDAARHELRQDLRRK